MAPASRVAFEKFSTSLKKFACNAVEDFEVEMGLNAAAVERVVVRIAAVENFILIYCSYYEYSL